MGDAAILQRFQDHLQSGNALGIGLGDDDGRVDAGQGQRPFVLEFDRAGTVEEGKCVSEEGDVRHVERNAHAVVAGFWRTVAHGVLFGDFTLSRKGGGSGEDGFEQRRLAGKKRAYQCNAAGAAARYVAPCWAIRIPHGVLLCRPLADFSAGSLKARMRAQVARPRAF